MIASFHDLKDKSVVVTGGGSGIGAALTEGFVAQGAKVMFIDRDDYSGFADELGKNYTHKPLFIQCDVTDTEALQDAIARAATAHGPFKAFVNNAANDQRMVADDVTQAQWDEMIDVNLKHYFFASQAAAAHMPQGGSIINFSSGSFHMGSPGMAPYVSSNAGIIGMSRALAREWGPRDIRVNSIAPGWVLTEKQLEKWATPEGIQNHINTQCLKTSMKPEDLVGTVLFLASDISKMITSHCLTVDAGVNPM